MKNFLLSVMFLSIGFVASAQTIAKADYAFQSQEKISYNVYYNVIGLYVHAGSATFTTASDKWQNEEVFHVIGEGSTNPKYDWIFKVRDRYESYFTATDMQPVKFVRNINEGNYKKHEEITFNRQAKTAITNDGVFSTPENVQDIVSALYYLRNINYDQYKPGDKIPFSMFLDNKVYNMYIHYIGKETIKTKFGKFNAIKIKPLLLQGNVFDGGEKMTAWITDDANHILLRLESPISVGKVKIDLMGYENLRYPMARE